MSKKPKTNTAKSLKDFKEECMRQGISPHGKKSTLQDRIDDELDRLKAEKEQFEDECDGDRGRGGGS
jgi:hypothetical protein